MVTRSSAASSQRRTQSFALASDHDDNRAAQIRCEQRPAGPRRGGDNAATMAVRVVDRLATVPVEQNRQAQRAAHRAAQCLPAERIRARARAHDAACSGCLGDAYDRSEVARLLHVESDDGERRASDRGACRPPAAACRQRLAGLVDIAHGSAPSLPGPRPWPPPCQGDAVGRPAPRHQAVHRGGWRRPLHGSSCPL